MWKGHPPSSSRHRRDRRDYAEAGYRRDYSRSISAAGSRGSATAHLQTRERLEPTPSGHSARVMKSSLLPQRPDFPEWAYAALIKRSRKTTYELTCSSPPRDVRGEWTTDIAPR